MSDLYAQLVPDGDRTPNGEPFSQVARYFRNMDFLLFLTKDCSYRADRIDHFLTLLWDPEKDVAVGVKLKGFRFLFDRVKAILEVQGIDFAEMDFMYIAQVLEVAMAAGLGEEMMKDAERERLEEGYKTARALIQNVKINRAELELAA